MKYQIFKLSLVLIAVVVTVTSCREELNEMLDDSMTVEEARTWYESSFDPVMVFNSSARKSGKPIVLQNNWKHAFTSKNDKYEVVETAMQLQGWFGIADEESLNRWKETGDRGYIHSISRFVVRKSKKNGKNNGFIMTVSGEADYLERKGFKLWDNTYLHKDKDFSGYILYHTVKGKFMKGWKMKDGKVTHEVKMGGDLPSSLSNARFECTTTNLYALMQECESWTQSTESAYGEWTVEFETCDTPVWELMDESTTCVTVEDDPGNTGGGGGGGSGNPYNNLHYSIPSINLLASNFEVVAGMSVYEVYNFIGGNVLSNFQDNPSAFSNACAIRLSYVLNMIPNHKIPHIYNQTISGDVNNDGIKEWYFYKVIDMVSYLNNTYGFPIETNTDEISGMTGIIWQDNCGWNNATGHLDIWYENNAIDHYYENCNDVYIWKH